MSDKETNVQIICRQTDYSQEVAFQKLKEHDGDIMKVIREFHGTNEKKVPEKKISNNQPIFKTIREFF